MGRLERVESQLSPALIEDLSKTLYFPYSSGLPIITEHPELRAGEVLRPLIPEEIIVARIRALAKEIGYLVASNSKEYVCGAILEGGRYFHDKVRGLWLQDLNSQIATAHSDIKSRYATETGKYEVISLPPPETVNNKSYIVFEGVVDSTTTLQILQEELSESPYKEVNLLVALLIDKVDAHPQTPLPACVKWCLFAMGNHWMVGCGPDVGEKGSRRFATLPYIAIYQKKEKKML